MNLENAGVLEIANLSLDEPELEGVLFSNNNNEDIDDWRRLRVRSFMFYFVVY